MEKNQLDHAGQADDQRYRHLFEHVPICIFVIDLTSNPATIVEANRRAELVYGYSIDTLVGMSVAQLSPKESEPAIQTILQQVQQGQTVTAELTTRHRDGTRFPVRMIAAPSPADKGNMIVTVEDVSAQKQRQNEAQAIESERRRIAHEIHDGVAQSLAGLRFKTGLWSHLAATAPPDMRSALDELQIVLADAITDLRRAIFALRPLDLDALGFFPTLSRLVSDFGDQNQLAAQLVLHGTQESLPTLYELPLFRIIQEGLNNVGQHSGASSVRVCLTVNTVGRVEVSLRDDGRGFDPRQLDPVDRDGHFGLRQMRERIVDLGGIMDIHSTLGQGTELVISLPPLVQERDNESD
jgi:PAS domain S-box-containing protein